MSLLDAVRRRFARAPEAVRAALPGDEEALAWGALTRDEGWLVATDRGLRRVGADGVAGEPLPWHEIASARWTAAGQVGGAFLVTPLSEVEPGVQARGPVQRHALTDAGELPAVVRRRVDQTVVASQRSPLPGRGGVLLVARRIPGQAGREWTVVFDDDADRADPVAREHARQKLADVVAAEQPE
ncbi:hypothetical protein JKP75_05780 [Blastococcus sp. TML/M2B]|uniref:hypothetical protein n=1 Tax=unclassified Blastococcus TaxID=2619396 RepID=UPI00190C27C3|nr:MULTISPECIES: hypothetical protein [unclassified Blastococcus]MBN1092116.1 hypothetical protein [Blastococcus sp. TML/M2B]MBN1097779.1 hypothetical protein [Blastococcus sp. TML/C7B]